VPRILNNVFEIQTTRPLHLRCRSVARLHDWLIDWLIDSLTSIYNIAQQIERYRMTERFHGRFSSQETGPSLLVICYMFIAIGRTSADSHSPVRSFLYASIVCSSVINTHATVCSLAPCCCQLEGTSANVFYIRRRIRAAIRWFPWQSPGRFLVRFAEDSVERVGECLGLLLEIRGLVIV
jgi:hypothetical protein